MPERGGRMRVTLAYVSEEPCWKCGGLLLQLDTPYEGRWRYHCETCEHLTVTRTEYERASEGSAVAIPGMRFWRSGAKGG